MLLLLLLVLSSWATDTAYELSDLQFGVPRCRLPGRAVAPLNSFGRLRLSNDLLGRALRFTVEPDATQASCRFCQIAARYCTQRYDGNLSTAAGQLHLAHDTQYNLRIIALRGNETSGALSLALAPRQQEIVVPTAQLGGPLCGARLRAVVLGYVTAEAPLVRDFQATARGADNESIQCSRAATGADLSCRLAPSYFVLSYALDNCVDWGAPAPLQAAPYTHSFVHYYTAGVGDAAALTLCGERWDSLYARARLELYCDADVALFVALRPWHRAALVTTAAWLSGARDLAVWRALDALEQYCEARDDLLPHWANVTSGLPSDEADDWEALCARQNVSSRENVTVPAYFYRAGEWYFGAFRPLIYFQDARMPAKSAALVAFVLACVLSLVLGVVCTVAYIWHRLRRQYTVL